MTLEQLKLLLPTADVWVANILAVGIALGTVKDFLSVLSLLVAIGYSAWRWQTEYKKSKDETKDS